LERNDRSTPNRVAGWFGEARGWEISYRSGVNTRKIPMK
jgi:hypothetical protein